MSKLIVVCGLGGSGKTTTAKELSRRLNVVCLHKDSIKSTIYDELGILTNESIKILFDFAEQQIANDVDLIIEGPFNYLEDAELFKKWQEKYSVNLFFIVCNADPEIRKKRVLERKRHICHKEADEKLLDGLNQTFDYSIMPGKRINIETNVPTDEIVGEIITELNFISK